jgi:hypothetical protein
VQQFKERGEFAALMNLCTTYLLQPAAFQELAMPYDSRS